MVICGDANHRFRRMVEEQDAIGWQFFMEGMLLCGLRDLQEIYTTIEGLNITGEQ